MVILCTDSTFIEFYCKEKEILDKVYNNCIDNGFEKVEYKSAEDVSERSLIAWQNVKCQKTLKLDAHAIKLEYLGKKAKIALYDLAVDKGTKIIYIVDKAGKIIAETFYKTK